jgi:PIN domain nuclease of toxin-antitoxin system
MAEFDLIELPVTAAHAIRSGLLEFGNSDPFDRMIVAQALTETLAVVSREAEWDGLGVIRIWT